MILHREGIQSAMEKGTLVICDFAEKSLQPASYDLRVGTQVISSSDKQIVDLDEQGFVQIKPGEHVIVLTREKLELSNRHAARYGLTGQFARKGMILSAGAQIAPGFCGCLVVGLTNLSSKSVILSTNTPFLTAEFHELSSPTEPYNGPYQGRVRLEQAEIEEISEREYVSLTEMHHAINRLVKDVEPLGGRMDLLEKRMALLEQRMEEGRKRLEAKMEEDRKQLEAKMESNMKTTLSVMSIMMMVVVSIFVTVTA